VEFSSTSRDEEKHNYMYLALSGSTEKDPLKADECLWSRSGDVIRELHVSGFRIRYLMFGKLDWIGLDLCDLILF